MLENLPRTWETARIEDVTDTIGGGTPSRRKKEYFRGDIPWLTGYDLPEGKLTHVSEGREYITEQAVAYSATHLVPVQTVLITTRVNVGKIGIADVPLCFSQDLTGLIIKDRQILDHTYLAYYLLRVRKYLLNFNRGTTIRGITRSDVNSLEIPLPPLPEQRLIVRILTQADDLRQLRRQANEKAARLPEELFYEAFEGGIAKTEDWQPIKLGEITSFITSGSRGWARYYSDRGGKFIRVQNVLMDELDLSDTAYVQPPDSQDKIRTAVKPGDLLITITGTTGRVAVAPTDLGEAYVSQHVAIVRMDGSISPHYVSAYIAHPLGGQWQLERMSYGQIKPGLNLAQIQSLEILRPPDELIDEFLERQSVARKVLETQKRATDRLERQIESLLTQAFTGELTAAWRDAHRDELERAAAEMRERLGVVRERPPVEVEAVAPPAIIEPIPTDLSPTQEAALTAAWEQRSPFTLLSLGRHATLQSLSRTRLREAVEMLVALGYLVETYVQSQDGPLLCLRLATRDDLLPAEEMSL